MRSKALLVAVVSVVNSVFADPPEPEVGYRWVINESYSDEFNGNKLDESKWNDFFTFGWQGRRPARFEKSSISVDEGNLIIRNGVLDKPSNGYTIAGGAVSTKKQDAYFGYYECNFKASRITMSTTFWLSNRKDVVNFATKKSNGENCSNDRYSQELDVMEAVGGVFNGTDKFRENMNFNTHYRYIDCNSSPEKFFSAGNNAVEGNGAKANAQLSSEVWEDFHTYGAYWEDANQVSFYADNKFTGTVQVSTDVVDRPFDRSMGVNLVTETYDWVRPLPTAEQLNDNSINASFYNWVRSYKLVKVDEDVTVDYPAVYQQSLEYFNNPRLINDNKNIELSYMYKANKNLELKVFVSQEGKVITESSVSVLRGFGKKKQSIELGQALSNGSYQYYVELLDGENVVASIGDKPSLNNEPIVNNKPSISFKDVNDDLITVTAGNSIDIEVLASDSDGTIDNVKLYIDDNFIRQESVFPYQWDADRDTVLSNLEEGEYMIRAEATDNKDAVSEIELKLVVTSRGDSLLSISEGDLINKSSEIEVFPNPSEGLINFSGLKSGDQVSLYDINGKELKEIIYKGNQLSISTLGNGLYILVMNKRKVVKVVKR